MPQATIDPSLLASLEATLAQQLREPASVPASVPVSLAPGGNGLVKLVLALVKLLHELLERQALRRIDSGSLTDEEIEKLGLTLLRQNEEIAQIARQFGLSEADLNLDLGPLGKLF